ncbi:hypothetical protein BBD42_01185 [Paenibacillus sp. BIHB 4019]|uniref:Protein kinase domain-containing protein n=1 Tax=Paenibacillus sp. BIHB 4019 TaxID=1870819 RepID=A0A1B2DC08_9BACL|nr:serine/threonine-protein kinase [Paenibacillus sp. BIHB 4019]ANY65243.1 hypothetical protein BBD42_01185 [Paenibacillus sp. BIHB 4019]
MEQEKTTEALIRNTRIGDVYQVKQAIHQSELSIVYKARQTETGELKLIKEFFPQQLARRKADHLTVGCGPAFAEKFRELLCVFAQEAIILKKLSHPQIVGYTDYIEANGTAYLVTEFCRGLTLEHYLQQEDVTRAQPELLSIAGGVVGALKYVHDQGIIHRDVKPGNIMIDEGGGVKLIDFGSAIPYGNPGKQLIFTSSGYSPLEFYSETSRQEPVSDIYSLAATLYYIFAGKAPLDVRQRLFEDNLAAVRSYNHRRISAPFDKLIHWGLAMSPEKRCRSLGWFAMALRWESLLTAGKRRDRQL